MDITFTARHFELAPELRTHITRKLEKLAQHVQNGIREARVILMAENYRNIAEVTLLTRRREFVGREESADMYTSADVVIEKLEQQLRRFKEKRISRGRRDGRGAAAGELRLPTISLREVAEEPEVLTVDEALDLLDQEGGEVLVFENKDNGKRTVLYRRQDGTYGMIEPEG